MGSMVRVLWYEGKNDITAIIIDGNPVKAYTYGR
jgi:hypothetical protein